MKRVFIIITVLLLAFSLVACGNSNETSDEGQMPAQENSETNAAGDSDVKELIVYFSWSGNTQAVAEEIQEQTGAEIFEIVPETAYSEDYDEVVDLAQEEQNNDVRPAISGTVENFQDYDVVYVGYPNWWGDMPMILYTFFDTYDFSGKIIAPFCTSGGSGFSNTLSEIESLEPEATVVEGLHLGESEATDSGEDVKEWLSTVSG